MNAPALSANLRTQPLNAHTLENCAESADRMVPYCDTFNRSVVKLLSFYLQKGGAKRTEQDSEDM